MFRDNISKIIPPFGPTVVRSRISHIPLELWHYYYPLQWVSSAGELVTALVCRILFQHWYLGWCRIRFRRRFWEPLVLGVGARVGNGIGAGFGLFLVPVLA
jgi:hypothetical protein